MLIGSRNKIPELPWLHPECDGIIQCHEALLVTPNKNLHGNWVEKRCYWRNITNSIFPCLTRVLGPPILWRVSCNRHLPNSIGNANMWCFCSLCIDAHNCMCPSRYEPPHLSCREFICKNVWNYISIWFDFYIYNYAALIALISIMRLNLVPQFCFNV